MNKNNMITPRATEKAYNLESKRTYVFFVPRSASKQSIAQAIAEAFKVTVTSVRVANRKGKATRFSRGKHAYPGITYKQDHKIAYITVKEGDKIPVFEEEKKAEQKPEKTEKTDKKAAKAKKDSKKDAKEEKGEGK